MSYRNVYDLLPEEIVAQIQEYVDGQAIYIPKKESNKKCWGENTDTRQVLAARNNRIYRDYQGGMSTILLSEKYHLAEKSIRRILKKEKNINFI
ncbi:CD3324 family protein [Clostridium transplantifaecale]|uniref:CD3324 family protein n=1 Tax=Clostridium transplantifaecale TaxID=2479838 RepID=UPI000F630C62|nr:CD3324 family protein [Clostridium transplantifaecale]